MKRLAIEERTRALTTASARQRASLAGALTPWRVRALQVDGGLERLRAHSLWIGFLGGLAAGILVSLRPRWLVPSARALATLWPVWRLRQWQRDRGTDRIEQR